MNTAEQFQAIREKLNDKFTVTIRTTHRLIGGIPAVNLSDDKGRDIMEAWLRKSLAGKLSEEEIAELAEKSFAEAYAETAEEASTTFKRDENGIYIECRQIKAMLKEAASRLGYGKAVKGTRPSLRQDIHEALHVDGDACYIMRDGQHVTEPDGYEARPIHVMTAMGPRTGIKKTAHVNNAELTFTVRILNMVALKEEHLINMLAFGQDLGIGADRSQGNGKFEVINFERI